MADVLAFIKAGLLCGLIANEHTRIPETTHCYSLTQMQLLINQSQASCEQRTTCGSFVFLNSTLKSMRKVTFIQIV